MNNEDRGQAASNATLQDQLMDDIDNETISIAYRILKEASQRIADLSRNVYSASEYCSATDFAIQGNTYQGSIEDCCNCFQYASKNIDEYADLLIGALKGQSETQSRRTETGTTIIHSTDPVQEYYVEVPQGGGSKSGSIAQKRLVGYDEEGHEVISEPYQLVSETTKEGTGGYVERLVGYDEEGHEVISEPYHLVSETTKEGTGGYIERIYGVDQEGHQVISEPYHLYSETSTTKKSPYIEQKVAIDPEGRIALSNAYQKNASSGGGYIESVSGEPLYNEFSVSNVSNGKLKNN